MSAVCPSCGVAVVPGYVKCPKCQAPLPLRRAQTSAAGGTAISEGGIPVTAIVIGIAAVAIVIGVFALRGGDAKPAPTEPTAGSAEPVAGEPTPGEPDVTPTPTLTQPTSADPTSAIRELESALARQRLWATVEAVGSSVDVRSANCREPTMMPILDAAIPALQDGGVAKIRCLEQGGAVVFARDL